MTAGGVLWTAAEAARATGGRCRGEFSATGVSIDSRTLAPGDLFVAIEGPNHDGHDYVAEALARGAAAAVVKRFPRGLPGTAPLVVVEDTFAALAALAASARARSRARIIAVTGSVGKTGTKEALRTVLGAQGPTTASEGNLNNRWGLPLSLARLPEDSAFGIFEMGMSQAGEIEPLSRLARPHVALITHVAPVHRAFFASEEAIAEAKAEVFAGLEPGGAAVLNRDNPHYRLLAAAARRRGAETVIAFGAHAEAAVRLIDASLDADGSDVTADVNGRELAFRVGLAGRHWIMNGLAVLATVMAAGADVAKAAAALDRLRPAPGRGRRTWVNVPGGRFLLIDESYNASPVSLTAALEVLGRVAPGPGGRRIAVLGDMLELGDDAGARHAALAEVLVHCGVDLAFTAGPLMAELSDALPASMRGGHAPSARALSPRVLAAVGPGDVVLVKGSLGSRTGVIVEALAGMAAAEPKRAANGD